MFVDSFVGQKGRKGLAINYKCKLSWKSWKHFMNLHKCILHGSTWNRFAIQSPWLPSLDVYILVLWKCIYFALGAQLCRLNTYECVCARTCVSVYVSVSWLWSVALDVLCLWKWLTQGFIFLHIVSICYYEISVSRSSGCICPFCDTLNESPEKALKKCSASVPNPRMCEADLRMSGVWHVMIHKPGRL